jgi:hypothetical protein
VNSEAAANPAASGFALRDILALRIRVYLIFAMADTNSLQSHHEPAGGYAVGQRISW